MSDKPISLEQEMTAAKEEGSDSMLMKYSKTWKPQYYPWAIEIRSRHEKSHWIEDEVELGDDVAQWKSGKITDIEKSHLTHILRLFTQSDVAVGQNYYEFFIPKFKNTEVRNMLGSFAAREAIHMHAYSLLNDTLGLPEEEYHAFLEYAEMKDKIEFMTKANVSTYRGLALALAKAVFNEGLSLFASFVMLLSYQRHGKMKGMCKIAEWSMLDENLHVEGLTKLFRTLCAEHPKIVDDEFKKEIYDIARTVVGLEDKFIKLAYELGEVEGLSADDVKKYIRYMADRRLIQLGLKGNWKIKENPIDWLDWINGDRHASFFETRVSDYSVGGLQGDWGYPDGDQ